MRHLVFVAILVSNSFCAATAQTPPSELPHVTSQSQIEDLDEPPGVAARQALRELAALALDVVKDFEQWRSQAYDDAAGYCTIGYGHLLAKKKCADLPADVVPASLTPDQGTEILLADSNSSRVAVEDLVTVELTDAQYGALSSFVFNVGKGNFKKSTLLKLVNVQSDLAADEFARWVKAGGVALDGLKHRRSCEAALFKGVLSYDATGKFDRNVCKAAPGVGDEAGPLIDIVTGE